MGQFRGPSLLALMALAIAPATASAESRLQTERSAEDWSGVSDVPFKDMNLGHDFNLTLGADARVKFELLDAPQLGVTGLHRDSWSLSRVMAHADLHAGRHVRLFTQLGVYDGIGRQQITGTDDDQLDFTQAFLDLNQDFGALHATLRVGRQELALGSPRFVTLRENTNLRQTHDLAHLILSDGPWRADLFSGRPTKIHPGAFDDEPDPSQEFFGARVERTFQDANLDFEYYDLAREAFRVGGGLANDRRHSLGVRLTAHHNDNDLDGEVLYQSGRYGALEVSAFGAALELGHTFRDQAYTPRLAARFTYGSGDHDPSDQKQQTFAPPFPRSAWFGQNGLSSFSNSIDFAGTLDLAPTPDVNLDFKFGGLWRADKHDFVYAGAATTLPNTQGGDTFIGIAPSAQITWRASPNVTIVAHASEVTPSERLRAAGASNVTYFNTTVALRF